MVKVKVYQVLKKLTHFQVGVACRLNDVVYLFLQGGITCVSFHMYHNWSTKPAIHHFYPIKIVKIYAF